MARLKSAFKEAVNYANEKAEMLVSRQRQGTALNEKYGLEVVDYVASEDARKKSAENGKSNESNGLNQSRVDRAEELVSHIGAAGAAIEAQME